MIFGLQFGMLIVEGS